MEKEPEAYKDSLGQANPAVDMERKNIAAAQKAEKEAEKDAEKAEKSENNKKTGKAH